MKIVQKWLLGQANGMLPRREANQLCSQSTSKRWSLDRVMELCSMIKKIRHKRKHQTASNNILRLVPHISSYLSFTILLQISKIGTCPPSKIGGILQWLITVQSNHKAIVYNKKSFFTRDRAPNWCYYIRTLFVGSWRLY